MEVTCCFCFSNPKKAEGKNIRKSVVSEAMGSRNDDVGRWEKISDELLTDASTFSEKEQDRRLKMAVQEEEKISREAERVVNWVKQQSAKIDVSSINTSKNEDKV